MKVEWSVRCIECQKYMQKFEGINVKRAATAGDLTGIKK